MPTKVVKGIFTLPEKIPKETVMFFEVTVLNCYRILMCDKKAYLEIQNYE